MHKVVEITGLDDPKILQTASEVSRVLENDDSGHGMDHIYRVLQCAFRLSENEDADPYLLTYLSLLHDVDDAKLFGRAAALDLPNAKYIMSLVQIDDLMQEMILKGIHSIGYQKRLQGIVPQFSEAKIVSDADMLDALGAHGILRTYDYGKSRHRIFFDRECFPSSVPQNSTAPSLNHFFEKLLHLNQMMQTQAGRQEANHRTQLMICFLRHYFEEEMAEDWLDYLNAFLQQNSLNGV